MPVAAVASVSPKATSTSEMDARSIKVNIDVEDDASVHARNGGNHDADFVDVERGGSAAMPSTAAASESTSSSSTTQEPAPFVPVWRVWPGKNRISCSGRIMIGSHLIGPGVTLSLIMLPSCAYLGAVLPSLRGERTFVPLLAISVTLLTAVLVFMAKTVCGDPGIIPRRRLPAGLTRSSFSTVPRFIKDKVRAFCLTHARTHARTHSCFNRARERETF